MPTLSSQIELLLLLHWLCFVVTFPVDAQLATSLIVAGAWIGCLLGSKPSELKGRKFTLLVNNVFFVAGAVLTALGNKPSLFVGRFVLGKYFHRFRCVLASV
jgi:MFS family permease